MSTSTLHAIPSPAATATPMREHGVVPPIGGGENFEQTLAGAQQGSDTQQLRTAAEQLVSHALLMPMMKMMRNDPFQTDLFHGGMAEDMFAAQLDQHMADAMAGRVGSPIVDAVYSHFTGGRGSEVDQHG